MKGGGSVIEFEKIYTTYFNDVYLYIRRLSADEHIAEEITSETFFKAIRSIDSFRGECELRVWLCQIAKNCYYSHLKKNRIVAVLEDTKFQTISDTNTLLDEQVVNQEEAMLIRKLLHTIPDPYKEVFMWRAFADLSFKQIGQIYNKTDNWACVTYHRARKIIKERLEEFKHEKGM